MPHSRFREVKLFIILLALTLGGCASRPTIHIYAKYLDEEQKQEIQSQFQSDEYRVEFNEFYFPTSITENTILYSLLLQEPELIDTTLALADSIGLPIQRSRPLTEGNHWYTKNSLAVFLFPEDGKRSEGLFWQDLVNDYSSDNCGQASSLSLNKDGSFQLAMSAQNEQTEQGVWKYRQFPFIELQKSGSAFSNYYFEIEQYSGSDQISSIEFIKLTLLNSGGLPTGCYFQYGLRS